MTFTSIATLPEASDILEQFPLSSKGKENVSQHREEINAILEGKDERLLLIIGPCSAFSDDAVLEYARRLKKAAEPLKKHVKVVLRVYTQKPRTTMGWKGALLHPDPFGEPDILSGINYCRKMMIQIIEEIGLPIADEILYPDLCLPYLSDLYSYGCIGARTSEHQRKRMIASGVEFSMGMKNPTSGDITKAIQGVTVAQAPNGAFPHIGEVVTTSGNPHAHLVLRGGGGRPNYYHHALDLATQLLSEQKIQNPSIVVDVSHENSIGLDGKKNYKNQITVAESVLQYRKTHAQSAVKGIMVESFLNPGNQTSLTSSEEYILGTSLTDPCLGWDETAEFLQNLTQNI